MLPQNYQIRNSKEEMKSNLSEIYELHETVRHLPVKVLNTRVNSLK